MKLSASSIHDSKLYMYKDKQLFKVDWRPVYTITSKVCNVDNEREALKHIPQFCTLYVEDNETITNSDTATKEW